MGFTFSLAEVAFLAAANGLAGTFVGRLTPRASSGAGAWKGHPRSKVSGSGVSRSGRLVTFRAQRP